MLQCKPSFGQLLERRVKHWEADTAQCTVLFRTREHTGEKHPAPSTWINLRSLPSDFRSTPTPRLSSVKSGKGTVLRDEIKLPKSSLWNTCSVRAKQTVWFVLAHSSLFQLILQPLNQLQCFEKCVPFPDFCVPSPGFWHNWYFTPSTANPGTSSCHQNRWNNRRKELLAPLLSLPQPGLASNSVLRLLNLFASVYGDLSF